MYTRSTPLTLSVAITGITVQHCINDDSICQWKWEWRNFDSYRIETPEPIAITFTTVDYVCEMKPSTKFDANPSTFCTLHVADNMRINCSFYRQDLPEWQLLPVLFLLTRRFLGFSPRRGDTLHRSRWNLAERNPFFPDKFHLDRFRGVGLRPSKLQKMEFYLLRLKLPVTYSHYFNKRLRRHL